MIPSKLPRCAALLLALLGLLVLLPGVAAAQGYGATVEVNVVTVDVEVRDAQGRQVTDLQRGDFQVFEDGQRMELTNFERVVRSAKLAAASAPGTSGPGPAPGAFTHQPPATEAAESRILVYVDNRHIHAPNRARALRQVREILATTHVPGEQVMVATEDLQLNVRLPFSDDSTAVAAVLDEIGRLPTWGLEQARTRATTIQATLTLQRDAIGLDQPCAQYVADPARGYAQNTRNEVIRTLSRLRFLINSLAGLPGRKALLYVSDGIPLQPGQEIFQVLFEICGGGAATSGVAIPDTLGGARGGPREGPSPGDRSDESATSSTSFPVFDASSLPPDRYRAQSAALDAASYDTTDELRRLAAHAAANRVAFYTLQASGLASLASADAALGAEDRLLQIPAVASGLVDNAKQPLVYLAHETGGRAMIDTNDFGRELGRMREGLATFYSLGYAPKHQGDGKEHRIEVSVKRPGIRLAYRRNYRDKGALEQTADRTLAALLHGYEDNPLAVTIEMLPSKELPNGHHLVTARLLVPLFKLATITHGDVHEAKLRVMVVAGEPGREATALRQVEVPIVVPHLQALTAFGQKYAYEVGMELTAGEHVVAFAVRDELGATTSFLRRQVRAGPVKAASASR